MPFECSARCASASIHSDPNEASWIATVGSASLGWSDHFCHLLFGGSTSTWGQRANNNPLMLDSKGTIFTTYSCINTISTKTGNIPWVQGAHPNKSCHFSLAFFTFRIVYWWFFSKDSPLRSFEFQNRLSKPFEHWLDVAQNNLWKWTGDKKDKHLKKTPSTRTKASPRKPSLWNMFLWSNLYGLNFNPTNSKWTT